MAYTIISFPITKEKQLIPVGTSYYLQREVNTIVQMQDTRKVDEWQWYSDNTYAKPCYLWNVTRKSILTVNTQANYDGQNASAQKIYTADGLLDYVQLAPGECGLFLPIVDVDVFPIYSRRNLGWFCTILTSKYGDANRKPWVRKEYTGLIDSLLLDVTALQYPGTGMTTLQLSKEVEKLNTAIGQINSDLSAIKDFPPGTGITKEQLDASVKVINNSIAALAAKLKSEEVVSAEVTEDIAAISKAIADLEADVRQLQSIQGITGKQLEDAIAKHLQDVDHTHFVGVTQATLDAKVKEINDAIAALPESITPEQLESRVKVVDDKIAGLQQTSGVTQEQLDAAIKVVNDKIAALPTASGSGITQEQLDTAIKTVNDKIADLPPVSETPETVEDLIADNYYLRPVGYHDKPMDYQVEIDPGAYLLREGDEPKLKIPGTPREKPFRWVFYNGDASSVDGAKPYIRIGTGSPLIDETNDTYNLGSATDFNHTFTINAGEVWELEIREPTTSDIEYLQDNHNIATIPVVVEWLKRVYIRALEAQVLRTDRKRNVIRVEQDIDTRKFMPFTLYTIHNSGDETRPHRIYSKNAFYDLNNKSLDSESGFSFTENAYFYILPKELSTHHLYLTAENQAFIWEVTPSETRNAVVDGGVISEPSTQIQVYDDTQIKADIQKVAGDLTEYKNHVHESTSEGDTGKVKWYVNDDLQFIDPESSLIDFGNDDFPDTPGGNKTSYWNIIPENLTSPVKVIYLTYATEQDIVFVYNSGTVPLYIAESGETEEGLDQPDGNMDFGIYNDYYIVSPGDFVRFEYGAGGSHLWYRFPDQTLPLSLEGLDQKVGDLEANITALNSKDVDFNADIKFIKERISDFVRENKAIADGNIRTLHYDGMPDFTNWRIDVIADGTVFKIPDPVTESLENLGVFNNSEVNLVLDFKVPDKLLVKYVGGGTISFPERWTISPGRMFKFRRSGSLWDMKRHDNTHAFGLYNEILALRSGTDATTSGVTSVQLNNLESVLNAKVDSAIEIFKKHDNQLGHGVMPWVYSNDARQISLLRRPAAFPRLKQFSKKHDGVTQDQNNPPTFTDNNQGVIFYVNKSVSYFIHLRLTPVFSVFYRVVLTNSQPREFANRIVKQRSENNRLDENIIVGEEVSRYSAWTYDNPEENYPIEIGIFNNKLIIGIDISPYDIEDVIANHNLELSYPLSFELVPQFANENILWDKVIYFS